MFWPRCFLWLALANVAQADSQGYMLGGGVESASNDGWRAAVLASVGLAEDTWVSAAASTSRVEVPLRGDSDIVYADIELDHYFEPLGFTIGAGYWGDPDLLDSNDLRASLYFRNDRIKATIRPIHRRRPVVATHFGTSGCWPGVATGDFGPARPGAEPVDRSSDMISPGLGQPWFGYCSLP
jgi:hypothetical protein